jgi:flagellar L-ring protein precursor FlgH
MGGSLSVGGTTDTSLTGTGSTRRNGTLAATITCNVVEVLVNGNLRLRGTKQITVNRETQYLTIEGVVRPRDILLDNSVKSDLVSDIKVESTGQGVIASTQKQGWGTAIVNAVSPF